MNIKIDNLADAIAEQLSQYNNNVTTKVKKAIKEEADILTNNIKADSPKETGRYAKGWTNKKEYETNLNINYKIYNKSKPSLTHLLENGHAKRDGGRVEGIDHISTNEEKSVTNLIDKISKAVSDN